MTTKEKLDELGIVTKNFYDKKSFLHNSMVVVACYDRELVEDFYFYSTYEKALFKITPESLTLKELYKDLDTDKYFIPRDKWVELWREEEEYNELVDDSFRDITIRQYACIHLGVPKSGLDWLDVLIKESNAAPYDLPPFKAGPK